MEMGRREPARVLERFYVFTCMVVDGVEAGGVFPQGG